jgi:hypothetical protein
MQQLFYANLKKLLTMRLMLVFLRKWPGVHAAYKWSLTYWPSSPRLKEASMATMNEKYGLSKVYQHDLADNGICKKCHKHVSKLELKTCEVVGEEEVAKFRDYNER